MTRRKPAQHLFAFRCDLQDCAAFVRGIRPSRDETFALGPVDKLNCAVVFQSQALGSVGDRDDLPFRDARNLQEKLVLLWVHARYLGSTLAEMQKAAKLETKFG